MTPKAVDSKEMCIPADDACDLLDSGMMAADYILSELSILEEAGITNPKIKAQAVALKKKLKAVGRKWDL